MGTSGRKKKFPHFLYFSALFNPDISPRFFSQQGEGKISGLTALPFHLNRNFTYHSPSYIDHYTT